MTRSAIRVGRALSISLRALQPNELVTTRLSLRAARRGYHSSRYLQDYPKEGVFQSNSPRSSLLNRPGQSSRFPQQDQADGEATLLQQPQYGSAPPPPLRRSRILRRLIQVGWLLAAANVGFFTILILGVDIIPLPLEPGSAEDREELEALQDEFDTLPLVEDLRAQQFVDPLTGQVTRVWREWPAYRALSDPASPIASLSRRETGLSTGPLKGSQGFAAQHVFWNESGKMAMIFMNFGEGVCGWPGNIHGGAIATFFDEALARVAGRCVDEKTSVTARLEVDYVAPCHPGQWYVIAATSVPEDVDPRIAEQPEPNLSSQKTILRIIREKVEHAKKAALDKTFSNPEGKATGQTGEDAALEPKKTSKVWVQGKLFCVDEAGPTLTDFAGIRPPDVPDPLHAHAVACGLFVVPKGVPLGEDRIRLGNIEF